MSISKTNSIPTTLYHVADTLEKAAKKDEQCGAYDSAGLRYTEAAVIFRSLGYLRHARYVFAEAERCYLQASASANANQCAQICTDLDKEIADNKNDETSKQKILRTDTS